MRNKKPHTRNGCHRAMNNKRTHAFGVPLRRSKFRRQVRIGIVTHAYTSQYYAKAETRCGISYTHEPHLVNNVRMLATRTSRDVDCMACLVEEVRR